MPFALTPERDRDLSEILTRYPNKMAACIPVLHLCQDQHGWINDDIIAYVSSKLDLPTAHVKGVVTFYTLFNQHPVGKHQVWVCRTLPCALRGAGDVLHQCEKKLGIKPGETTPDGKVTLRTAECLASCGTAPMMQVDRDYYENLSSADVDKILDGLMKGTPVAPTVLTAAPGAPRASGAPGMSAVAPAAKSASPAPLGGSAAPGPLPPPPAIGIAGAGSNIGGGGGAGAPNLKGTMLGLGSKQPPPPPSPAAGSVKPPGGSVPPPPPPVRSAPPGSAVSNRPAAPGSGTPPPPPKAPSARPPTATSDAKDPGAEKTSSTAPPKEPTDPEKKSES